jgi:hypothetical protein
METPVQPKESPSKAASRFTFNLPLLFIVLAVTQFTLQTWTLGRGIPYTATNLTNDDTYYYLQTAWNTPRLGFATFDGLHRTNGVQLLWFCLLLVFSPCCPTKISFLQSALIVCFVFNALCYLIIWKLGKMLHRPLLAFFMASLWCLQSLSVNTYSSGMENSLHAFIFWCLLWQATAFLVRSRHRNKLSLIPLSIVLILNVWARLDAALFSIVIFSFCAGVLLLQKRGIPASFGQKYQTIITSAALLCGGIIAQLAAFRCIGGSFIPVSALIKSAQSTCRWNGGFAARFIETFQLSFPQLLPERLPLYHIEIISVISVLIILYSLLRRNPQADVPLTCLQNLWCCLFVGVITYHFILATLSCHYAPYYIWYRSPLFIFWILTYSIAADTIAGKVFVRSGGEPLRKFLIVFCLLIFAVSYIRFARRQYLSTGKDNIHSCRYHAAQRISEQLPPGIILASWNAGELGFFSNRNVINLDGLANSVDYYREVLGGDVPLMKYLRENDVTYLVDYQQNRHTLNLPVVERFPCHDGCGTSLFIWKIENLADPPHQARTIPSP